MHMKIHVIQRSGQLLQAIQAAFEGQSEEFAKLVASNLTKKETFTLRNVSMTSVDVSSLFFVMKFSTVVKVLR